MIKQTLEEIKKEYKPPFDLLDVQCHILTSHISYLDEKIQEIDEYIRNLDRNDTYTKEGEYVLRPVIRSLQKEKSQAEELLKNL